MLYLWHLLQKRTALLSAALIVCALLLYIGQAGAVPLTFKYLRTTTSAVSATTLAMAKEILRSVSTPCAAADATNINIAPTRAVSLNTI